MTREQRIYITLLRMRNIVLIFENIAIIDENIICAFKNTFRLNYTCIWIGPCPAELAPFIHSHGLIHSMPFTSPVFHLLFELDDEAAEPGNPAAYMPLKHIRALVQTFIAIWSNDDIIISCIVRYMVEYMGATDDYISNIFDKTMLKRVHDLNKIYEQKENLGDLILYTDSAKIGLLADAITYIKEGDAPAWCQLARERLRGVSSKLDDHIDEFCETH